MLGFTEPPAMVDDRPPPSCTDGLRGQGSPASHREDAANEFHPEHPPGDKAEVLPECDLQLWMPLPAACAQNTLRSQPETPEVNPTIKKLPVKKTRTEAWLRRTIHSGRPIGCRHGRRPRPSLPPSRRSRPQDCARAGLILFIQRATNSTGIPLFSASWPGSQVRSASEEEPLGGFSFR